jgi:hypothetical protein
MKRTVFNDIPSRRLPHLPCSGGVRRIRSFAALDGPRWRPRRLMQMWNGEERGSHPSNRRERHGARLACSSRLLSLHDPLGIQLRDGRVGIPQLPEHLPGMLTQQRCRLPPQDLRMAEAHIVPGDLHASQ